MVSHILRVLAVAGALLIVARYVPGISIASWKVAIIAALVLGLLNTFVRPVISFFALPITLLTLGLFSFVISAAIFGLTAYLLEGFTVSGFVPALLGSLVVSIVGAGAHHLFK